MIIVFVPERKNYHEDLDEMRDYLFDLAEKLGKDERTAFLKELREKEHFIFDIPEKRFYNADAVFRYLASQIEEETSGIMH
jgi:hypothetical protein